MGQFILGLIIIAYIFICLAVLNDMTKEDK